MTIAEPTNETSVEASSPTSAPTEPYLIALRQRLLDKTAVSDDGCWYCTAGGENSHYGTIWYLGCNISNHTASWLVHKGTIPKGMCVLHTCDNKRCINPDHLFLGTKDDNSKDMVRKGRQVKRLGVLNTMAVLTEDKVHEIKQLLSNGEYQKDIAEYFGVSQVTISQINTRTRWSHVK